VLTVILLSCILFPAEPEYWRFNWSSITGVGFVPISTSNVIKHLAALEEIADANDGSRSVANGHSDSVDYVISQLELVNDSFIYWTQEVPVWVQVDTEEPHLRLEGVELSIDIEPRIGIQYNNVRRRSCAR
jgi:hypothetical protein